MHKGLSRGLRGLAVAGLLAVTTMTGAGSASAEVPLSTFDKEYLPKVVTNVYFETQYAALAREKATNDKVRAYGEMFLSEHGAVKDTVVELANREGIVLPTALPANLQENIDNLRTLSGAAFDRAWAEGSAMSHQRSLATTTIAVKEASNPEVKSIADRSLAIVKGHYSHALALARELGTSVPKLVNTGDGPAESAPMSRVLPFAAALSLLVAGAALLTTRRAVVLHRVQR